MPSIERPLNDLAGKPRLFVSLLAIVLTAGIFLLDLITPLGKAIWTLYLIPLLLASWTPNRQVIGGLTALQTLLILLGSQFASPGVPLPVWFFNRAVGISVICIAAALILQRQRTHQAFQQSHAQLVGILQNAADAIVSVDQGQQITLFNQGAEKIFGYAAEEVVGRPLDILLPQPLVEVHRQHVRNFSAASEVSRLMGERREIAGRRKDGTEFPAEASISKLVLEGKLILTVILRDITRRKELERRLAVVHEVTGLLSKATTSQQGTTSILQTIGESLAWDVGAIWQLDDSANVLHCLDLWHSPTIEVREFEQLTWATALPVNVGLPGRVVASTSPTWIVDVTQDANFPRASAATKVGLHGAFAFPIQIGKRTVGVLEFFSRQMRQPDQELLHLLSGLGQQIGQFMERIRSEEKLLMSEARLRAIFDSEPDCVKIVGKDGTLLEMNPAGLRMLEAASGDSVLSKPALDLIHPDDRDIYQTLHEQAMRNQPGIAEFRMIGASGTIRWMETHAVPLRDASAVVHSVLSVTRDITQRKQAEEALKHTHDFILKLFDEFPTPIWRSGLDAKCDYFNKSWLSLTGRTMEQELGDGWAEGVHPDDLNRCITTYLSSFQARVPFTMEYRLRRHDGVYRWVADFGRPYYDLQGNFAGYIGSCYDCTSTKEAEQALLIKTKQLQAITSAMMQFLMHGDWREASVTILRSALEFTQSGYGFIGIVAEGPTLRILAHEGIVWDKTINQDLYEKALRTYRELGYIEFTNFENLFGRVITTGETVVSNDPSSDPRSRGLPPGHPPLLNFLGVPILKGSDVLGMIGLANRPGGYADTELAQVAILTQAVSVLYDSYRQQQRQTELENQLRQSQKMEAIGRLAGGIAHDFNNLLTIITGYCDLSLETLAPNLPERKGIQEILQAGKRAAALTSQLLAFSRRQVLQPQALDLNQVVTRMRSMLQRLIGEDVEIRMALGPALGQVKADSGQIEQVLMNLAVNARDAMPNGGQLTIETTNTELDQAFVAQHIGAAPGSYVMLAISDTGMGMDPATRARIFEPFFTTKEPGKGTGLGLSMVYGIVKQSGGSIWVYSEVGYGTTFRIYLPRLTEEVSAPERPAESSGTLRGTETVLLVEDQETVRMLIRKILERYGYTVLAAGDAREAQLISEEHQSPIDLLITDVVMPQGSGREVAERLTANRPNMKVLYISGFTDNTIARHGILDPGMAFLQKPFSPDALACKVRDTLAPRKGEGPRPKGGTT